MDPAKKHIETFVVLSAVFLPLLLAILAPLASPIAAGLVLPLFLLAIFGVGAALIGDSARKKGRNFYSFFWLSYLISPVITGIIVATLPSQKDARPSISPNGAAVPMSEELERLAGLRDSGSLSEEEFQLAKKRILG